MQAKWLDLTAQLMLCTVSVVLLLPLLLLTIVVLIVLAAIDESFVLLKAPITLFTALWALISVPADAGSPAGSWEGLGEHVQQG